MEEEVSGYVSVFEAETAIPANPAVAMRTCTCSDPDFPCQHKYAYSQCLGAWRDNILLRCYGVLDWICGEGLAPWPEGSYPDPDDLYLDVSVLLGTEMPWAELQSAQPLTGPVSDRTANNTDAYPKKTAAPHHRETESEALD